MITITREDAINSIRMMLNDYYQDTDQAERELLNGAYWRIERHNGWNLPNVTRGKGSAGELDTEDIKFCEQWMHLKDCASLDEVPDEFLKELLCNLGNISWLMNARQV